MKKENTVPPRIRGTACSSRSSPYYVTCPGLGGTALFLNFNMAFNFVQNHAAKKTELIFIIHASALFFWTKLPPLFIR